MSEVYYYVKSEDLSDIIDCGLKLSAFHDKEVLIDGEKKLCFSGLINPKDDLELYNSTSFTCIKVQVKPGKCFVADRFIYNTAKGQAPDLELYYKTILPLEDYRFGTYRLPECLITTTILAGEAAVLDKRMDSPVLYTNSEELYINNILQELREEHAEIDDVLLYSMFDKLYDKGLVEKMQRPDCESTVFLSKSGKTYCIKKPELDRFIII